jgi:hypothetical protein
MHRPPHRWIDQGLAVINRLEGGRGRGGITALPRGGYREKSKMSCKDE